MVFCTHHDGQTVLNVTLTCLCHLLYSIIEANKAEWNFQLLSIGPVHFRFKVSLVVFIIYRTFYKQSTASDLPLFNRKDAIRIWVNCHREFSFGSQLLLP